MAVSSAKITAAVDKAFVAMGDLVKSGTLSSKRVTGYDFSTQSTIGKPRSTAVKVIILDKKTSSGIGFTLQAIMKTGVDMTVYDTLTVDKVQYNITEYTDNGFVIEAVIVRDR